MDIKLHTPYVSHCDNIEYPILKLADGSYMCIAYSTNHKNYYVNVYTEEDFIDQGYDESYDCNDIFDCITKDMLKSHFC